MREEQVELLKRMTHLIESISTDDPILEKISQLMSEIAATLIVTIIQHCDFTHFMRFDYP